MKKNGFTLVELIAVLVILMVIVLLATSGYRLVLENIKETAYANKISNIEVKAVEYANSTGNKTLNVDQLVKAGKITADDEDGHVINPIDGSYLNCHLVYVMEENENLYGNYTDQEECSIENINIENMFLTVKAYKTNEANEATNELITEDWTRTNVMLVAEVAENTINVEHVVKIIWKSNVEQEEREILKDFYDKNKYLITAEQIVNATYSAQVVMDDGKVYYSEVVVRIDKQRPIVYDSEIKIEKENEWSTEKEISIKASDGNGSGIYGYYVGTNSDCVNALYEEHKDNVYKKTIEENGTYYICVRDNAGNVSEDVSTKSFTINNIDKVAPKVTVKNNPLTLGSGDYEFKDNLEVVWSESGEGVISCNPTVSKKTGIYDVTCIAIGNNGLSTEVSFNVKHSYPATYHYCSRTEKVCDSCKQVQDCESWCVGVCSDVPCTDCCCKWAHGSCKWVTACEGCRDVEVNCSYYTCPLGGSLSGSTCYY